VGNDLNARVHKRFGERLTNILHGRTWEGGTYPEAEGTTELPKETGSLVIVTPKTAGGGEKYRLVRKADGSWRGKMHLVANDDDLRRGYNVVHAEGPVLPQGRGAGIEAQTGSGRWEEYSRLSDGQWVSVDHTCEDDAELFRSYDVVRVL
jgi:hypothetical protein